MSVNIFENKNLLILKKSFGVQHNGSIFAYIAKDHHEKLTHS